MIATEHLTAGLTGTQQVRFAAAVQTICDAFEAGQIANVDFKNCKETINRALERSYHHAVNPFLPAIKVLPSDQRQIGYTIAGVTPYLHTISSIIRLIDKIETNHPVKAAALALLNEALPLANMVADLKGRVMKRQPKPVEDRKAKYNAPGASLTAIGRVKTLLEQVTEGSRAELAAFFVARYQRWLDTFLTEQEAAIADGKTLNPYSMFASRNAKQFNPSAYSMVEHLVETGHGSVYAPKKNASALIQKAADTLADEIRDNFVYKNLGKLDSIVDAKADLEKGEVLSRKIDLGGMEGVLRFTFKDGASFVVRNSVVWSVSIYGKEFQRTPLTFHEVVLSGGKKMAKPSEERMNTVFVGKGAT